MWLELQNYNLIVFKNVRLVSTEYCNLNVQAPGNVVVQVKRDSRYTENINIKITLT